MQIPSPSRHFGLCGLVFVSLLGLSMGCGDSGQTPIETSSTGLVTSGPGMSSAPKDATASTSPSTQSSTASSTQDNTSGEALPAPACTTLNAVPTPPLNTMTAWHGLPLPSAAIGQELQRLGQLFVHQNAVFVTGHHKLHRIDLETGAFCSFASPNNGTHAISTLQMLPGGDDLLVSFRNPGRKEGQMGRYIAQGHRFVTISAGPKEPATALLAMQDGTGELLASFPGTLFSVSKTQGDTWTQLQAQQDGVYTDLRLDKSGTQVWAFGKDSRDKALVTQAPRDKLGDPQSSTTSDPTRWTWDADHIESVIADPHTEHSMLIGTTSLSSQEALLARASGQGSLSARELWVGASTTPFVGITAILPLQPETYLLGGKAKKAGAAVVLMRGDGGKTREIAVSTDRKLRVLDIQPLPNLTDRTLVSSTDGSTLFLHVLGQVQL